MRGVSRAHESYCRRYPFNRVGRIFQVSPGCLNTKIVTILAEVIWNFRLNTRTTFRALMFTRIAIRSTVNLSLRCSL
jgi:hypothetical protein